MLTTDCMRLASPAPVECSFRAHITQHKVAVPGSSIKSLAFAPVQTVFSIMVPVIFGVLAAVPIYGTEAAKPASWPFKILHVMSYGIGPTGSWKDSKKAWARFRLNTGSSKWDAKHDSAPGQLEEKSRQIIDVSPASAGLFIDEAGYSAGEADQLRRSMAAWKRHGGLEPHQRNA
jgi:hypothetical protein